MTDPRRSVGLLVLALAAAASTLSADETYVIRLTRPARIGDRYRLDAKGVSRERHRITAGGNRAESEEKELAVHLIAAATVLKVDPKLKPIRIEYRIESCRKTSAGKTEEILPAGRKLIAESKKGETVLTSDGDRPLDAETLEALELVISPEETDSPTDDEIFGSRERKRVGDKWSVNAAVAARAFAKNGVPVTASGLKGTVQLDGVRTIDGVEALEITSRLRMEGLKMPEPEGRLRKTVLDGEFHYLVPVDPRSRFRLPERLAVRMNMTTTGQNPDPREKFEVEVSIETTLENTYLPIQEDPQPRSSLEHVPGNRILGPAPLAAPKSGFLD